MEKIIIEDGLYNGDLLKDLWRKKADVNFNRVILQVLKKLCQAELTKENFSDSLSFTDEEMKILNNINIIDACENKEIVARWYDYVQSYDKIKRPKYLKQSCINYQEIYKATNNYAYLVRSLQLIRKAKGLFKSELEEIFDYTKNKLIICDKPFWQKRLLKELVFIFGSDLCQKEFSAFIESRIESLDKTKNYHNVKILIDCLREIDKLTNNEWRIKIAENYEKEGDFLVADKKLNTYYPSISNIYLNALREIKSVPNCDDLRNRLKIKVSKEQIEDRNMIQLFGAPMIPEIDYKQVQKNISELNIDSLEAAFQLLLSIPVVSENTITEYVNISKDAQSPITQFFSQTIKLNASGSRVGSADGDDALINNARAFSRDLITANIRVIKNIMDTHKKIDEDFILNSITQSKSRFIPIDRIYIYTIGIFEGFNNNFILAAHLLMPQFENSLRYVASQNGIETTKLTEEIQHENMLGGCLEKIMGFTNNDLHKELKNFLIDISMVNFRNELSHGLMSTNLIDHYGLYLWWLSLKLIFQTESYFSFNT